MSNKAPCNILGAIASGTQSIPAPVTEYDVPRQLNRDDCEALVRRLIEHWEGSGHPLCPDPACGIYLDEDPTHERNCLFAKIAGLPVEEE